MKERIVKVIIIVLVSQVKDASTEVGKAIPQQSIQQRSVEGRGCTRFADTGTVGPLIALHFRNQALFPPAAARWGSRGLECIRRKTLGGIRRTVATGVRTGGQAEKVFVPAVGQEPTGSIAMSSGRGGGPSAPNLH